VLKLSLQVKMERVKRLVRRSPGVKAIYRAGRKPIKFKTGSKSSTTALARIRYHHKFSSLLISKPAFSRLVHEIMEEIYLQKFALDAPEFISELRDFVNLEILSCGQLEKKGRLLF